MVLHDFYRGSEEQTLELDIKRSMRLGHDIIDYICPDSLEFKSDYFRMGDKYGRVIFLKDLASFIKDSMVSEITDFSRNLMFSIDILPIPTDEAVKEVQKKILGIETDITRWQQKQNISDTNRIYRQCPIGTGRYACRSEHHTVCKSFSEQHAAI